MDIFGIAALARLGCINLGRAYGGADIYKRIIPTCGVFGGPRRIRNSILDWIMEVRDARASEEWATVNSLRI